MIEIAILSDLPTIKSLYDRARIYQRQVFPDNVWPMFNDSLIRQDLQEKRLYKLLDKEQLIAVWTITLEDPIIWPGSDQDKALYLHRIASSSKARGKNLMKIITQWSKEFAISQGLQFIRMDTCGPNSRLIRHYNDNGFSFKGMRQLNVATGLPQHYHNAQVCYFEINLFS